MNQHKRTPSLVCLTVLLFSMMSLLFPTMAQAENMNFYVQPKMPKSQLEGTTNYYNLNLSPGSQEKLELTVTNATNSPIKLKLSAHTAYTNVNGVVEYGRDSEEADNTLQYELSELLSVPEESIELSGEESRDITVDLTMPEEAFSGLLAGGIRIEEDSEEEEEEEEGGFAVKNAFAFILGVVVSNERTDIAADLELTNVFADQLNYRNVFSANLQNPTPGFINQLEVNAEIREKGDDRVIYEAETSGMQMAPNSNFNYPIPLNGERFRNGTYVASIVATSGEDEWSWEYEFTVDQTTARSLNREDVTIEDEINWWLIICFVLLLTIVVYLIIKRQKEKKAQGNAESRSEEGEEQ